MTDNSNQQYGEYGRCEATAKSHGDRCKRAAVGPHGKCDVHGGKTPSGTDSPNFEHGAFSEQFTSHLTGDEQAAFADAREQLAEPEGAQDIAREAAAMCLLKFRRTGRSEFLRRFEGLCDKFNIAPDEELTVNMKGVEQALLDDVRSYHTGGDE